MSGLRFDGMPEYVHILLMKDLSAMWTVHVNPNQVTFPLSGICSTEDDRSGGCCAVNTLFSYQRQDHSLTQGMSVINSPVT